MTTNVVTAKPRVIMPWLIQNRIFVLLGLTFVWALAFVPYFATSLNLSQLLTQLSVDGIVALGMTILMVSFGVDLSAGSTLALSGVVYALFQGVGIPIAMFLGVLVGALVGLVNGLVVTRMKVNFFIATLATMTGVRGLVLALSDSKTIYGSAQGFDWVGTHKIGPVEFPVIVFFSMAFIAHIILAYTRLGRYWYAIGGNADAARRLGLDVDKYFALAFVVVGLCAGISGVLLASRSSSGAPSVGQETALIAIASTVVGGTSLYGGVGSIPGAVAGILLINLVRNSLILLGVSPYYQYVVQGLILVGVVVMDAYFGARHGTA
jgi:ribose/xylose/arabinose/galactoside ABC-type transport system permease subunit